MIPIKLLLRVLTVLTLTRGGAEPYPTMAGPNVFDTRIAPLTDVAADVSLPIIVVYTDMDQRRTVDNSGNMRRSVVLVIEIAISGIAQNNLVRLETDPELEATLDLFEAETLAAFGDPSNPWAMKWKGLVRSTKEVDIEPFRSSDQAQRYAVRRIVFEVDLANDCLPAVNAEPVAMPMPPAPYLDDLWSSIKAEPIFASTRMLLTGARSTNVPLLERFRVTGQHAELHLNVKDDPPCG